MKSTIADIANWVARNGPFVLTAVCVVGTMVLAVFKDSDVNTLLPTILGIYMAQKGSQAVSAHLAASKDEKCDTAQVIRDLEGLPHEHKEP
jgi:heme O synthase-like polyprenyltransferase